MLLPLSQGEIWNLIISSKFEQTCHGGVSYNKNTHLVIPILSSLHILSSRLSTEDKRDDVSFWNSNGK